LYNGARFLRLGAIPVAERHHDREGGLSGRELIRYLWYLVQPHPNLVRWHPAPTATLDVNHQDFP
jgi:hypothetical protein